MQSLMNGCRWVEPASEDAQRSVETWSLDALLGFSTQRIFWLTNIAEGQWRGRHAHRESVLATFAVVGGCRLTLDDGQSRQIVELHHDGPGVIIGRLIWHDLFDFLPSSVILVAASTLYDEAEYIRDYTTFLRESRASKAGSPPDFPR